MKLTDVALKNKVTTYLIFITLLLVGYMSYEKSEKSEEDERSLSGQEEQ